MHPPGTKSGLLEPLRSRNQSPRARRPTAWRCLLLGQLGGTGEPSSPDPRRLPKSRAEIPRQQVPEVPRARANAWSKNGHRPCASCQTPVRSTNGSCSRQSNRCPRALQAAGTKATSLHRLPVHRPRERTTTGLLPWLWSRQAPSAKSPRTGRSKQP